MLGNWEVIGPTQPRPISVPIAEEDSSGYVEPEPLPDDVTQRLKKVKL